MNGSRIFWMFVCSGLLACGNNDPELIPVPEDTPPTELIEADPVEPTEVDAGEVDAGEPEADAGKPKHHGKGPKCNKPHANSPHYPRTNPTTCQTKTAR